MLTSQSYAQTVSGPADVGRIKPEEKLPTYHPRQDNKVVVPNQAPTINIPEIAKKITLTLSAIHINGASVFSEDELRDIYAPYLGKEITLDVAYVFAGQIMERYRNGGLSAASAVNVASGATLDLNGYSGSIASLLSDGTVTFGTGNSLTSSGVQQYNGAVTGNGISLISTTGGNITANNVLNDFTGNLNISTAGTVNIVDANALSLGTVTVDHILARALNGNLVVNGLVQASSSGNDAIIFTASANFVNNVGSNVFTTGAGGRWLVYSTSAASDTIGGLSHSFQKYNCAYGACSVGSAIPSSGNGFVYSAVGTDTGTAVQAGSNTSTANVNYSNLIPVSVQIVSQDATINLGKVVVFKVPAIDSMLSIDTTAFENMIPAGIPTVQGGGGPSASFKIMDNASLTEAAGISYTQKKRKYFSNDVYMNATDLSLSQLQTAR